MIMIMREAGGGNHGMVPVVTCIRSKEAKKDSHVGKVEICDDFAMMTSLDEKPRMRTRSQDVLVPLRIRIVHNRSLAPLFSAYRVGRWKKVHRLDLLSITL